MAGAFRALKNVSERLPELRNLYTIVKANQVRAYILCVCLPIMFNSAYAKLSANSYLIDSK